MQYMLKILPSILFSASGCSRQQTHSLRIGMISHRSQVHQNGSSKAFWFKTVGLKISHDSGHRTNLLANMTSRLAASFKEEGHSKSEFFFVITNKKFMPAFLWGDPDPDQRSKVCLDHGASKEPVNP